MIKTIIIILLILFIIYNFPAVLFIDRNRVEKMTELGIKDKPDYYNFISRTDDNHSDIVLVELSDKKEKKKTYTRTGNRKI